MYTLPSNIPIPKDDGACDDLVDKRIPDISLLNQDEKMLKLNRSSDTFRIVLYCFPMTGHPEKTLPSNWNNIPGARGCTPQTCSFRDNYDEIMKFNALPIGMSTQSTAELKEMSLRLKIPYDLVSDQDLKFSKTMKLPIFTINNKEYIKRLTLIIERSIIKYVFYPIFPPDQHVFDVIKWLKKND
tara:strand:- start:244 stop:798 length:555 start_codon:yes stop_codon:yes gene_type:complete